MNRLKNLLKKIIQVISGYKLQGIGDGSFAFIRENIEVNFFGQTNVLFMKKENNEIEATREIYDYLRKKRLKTILDDYQINIVLDVGANKGQFAEEIRQIGYGGRIISFEPISSAFDILKKLALNDPDWDVQKLALGKENGEQNIYVSDYSVFTSFLKSRSWSEEQFGQVSLGKKEETVVRRLDEVLSEMVDNLDQARIYLKMDTQGYDLEVFTGLGNSYESIFALQSEMSVIPIYDDMPHLTESIKFYEKAGFEIAGTYPVCLEKSTLRIIEFDCFMVNSRINKAV